MIARKVAKMSKTFGYMRVSTLEQDLEKQEYLLLDYANKKKIHIDEFIKVEMSSRKSLKERRIEELLSKVEAGDTLIVAELSRLGRELLEIFTLVSKLQKKRVVIIFIRQPELSTEGPQAKLLLSIYAYFAETERELISIRTKEALAAKRARGESLGRPKGAKNKRNKLDCFRETIKEYVKKGVNTANIKKIIMADVSYNTFRRYVAGIEAELRENI